MVYDVIMQMHAEINKINNYDYHCVVCMNGWLWLSLNYLIGKEAMFWWCWCAFLFVC